MRSVAVSSVFIVSACQAPPPELTEEQVAEIEA